MTDLLSPRQPHGKSVAGAAAFLAQQYFSLHGEIQLSRIPLFATLFSRLRDAMVSETLKLVYFPIPKSACTTFATLLALHDAASQDFDPTREGVHGYRFRTGTLRIKDMRCLARDDYFKFTVIRDPYSRLVSAYLDKLIKPRRNVAEDAAEDMGTSFPGDLTFEGLVHFLAKTPDHAIEKHWRPQHTFFRNVHLDYIGCFERLEHAFGMVRDQFGIDIEEDVLPKVKSSKRTPYATADDGRFLGDVPPAELARLEHFPPADAFYNDRLRELVETRYARDLMLHRTALESVDTPLSRRGVGSA